METYRARYPDAPEWPSSGFDMDVARKRIVSIGENQLSNELKAAIEYRIAKPNSRLRKPNLRLRKRPTKSIWRKHELATSSPEPGAPTPPNSPGSGL